ncbi:MAG: NADH-quinone oxidoreductase subunit J, partial [Rhodothermales bacterium]
STFFCCVEIWPKWGHAHSSTSAYMLAQILFLFVAVVAIAAGIGLIVSRSPVSSALWLVLNLFCIAVLYVTMNAQFIGVIQILVYAGAIMVLFLFVIMLLNLSALPDLQLVDWKIGVAFLLGMAVLAQLVYVVAASLDVLPVPSSPEMAAESGSAATIGRELFTTYALPLEVVGVLLLAATIGAVMLAKRRFV